MDSSRLTYLLERYAAQALSQEEKEELLSLLDNDPQQTDSYVETRISLYGREPYKTDISSLQPMIDRIIGIDKPAEKRRYIPVWRWAAAILVLLAGSSIYYFVQKGHGVRSPAASQTLSFNKPVLILSDGSVVDLDSTGNKVIRQGNTQIQQSKDALEYTSGNTDAAPVYNTLKIPRGRQYQLRLPDGTHVWLNTATSLKYPVAFNQKERLVEVSGEAYFDIAQHAEAPFIVKVGEKTKIEVLGTQFNIAAYPDDTISSATLTEGSIRIVHAGSGTALKPGQQAIVNRKKEERIHIIQHADIRKAIAWKSGFFNFEGASLQEVMKQLQRWYDIEVVYEKGIPDMRFEGEISRDLQLPEILNGLKVANVHFRLENGKKLIIIP